MSKIAVEVGLEHGLKPEVRGFVDWSSRHGWQPKDLHYRKRCDLREIKIPAIFHLESRRTGNHQLELIEADTMSYTAILKTLSSVVEDDPHPLRLMRIDLSADVPEIPLDWFRIHVRVPAKRTTEVYGKHTKAGNKRTSGLFYGSNYDLLRIYDKLQELAFKRKPFDFPFTSWGEAPAPTAITRVERQFRGNKIPTSYRHVGSLPGIADFDPFDKIRFEMSRQVPFGRGRTVRNVLAARGLQSFFEEVGPQVARHILNQHTHGKASRLIRSLSRMESITAPNLCEIYRAELLAQLKAA